MNLGVQQGAQTGEHCIATVCGTEKEDLNGDGCEDMRDAPSPNGGDSM